jgi:hypothetical protein
MMREVADEQLCVHEALCAKQTQSVDMSRRYWIFESRERPSRTQTFNSQHSDNPINTEERIDDSSVRTVKIKYSRGH